MATMITAADGKAIPQIMQHPVSGTVYMTKGKVTANGSYIYTVDDKDSGWGIVVNTWYVPAVVLATGQPKVKSTSQIPSGEAFKLGQSAPLPQSAPVTPGTPAVAPLNKRTGKKVQSQPQSAPVAAPAPAQSADPMAGLSGMEKAVVVMFAKQMGITIAQAVEQMKG